MIKSLLALFGTPDELDEEERLHQMHLAAAALLIEMSRADYSVDASEQAALERVLKQGLDLPDDEIAELIELGKHAADKATSLYEFTRQINDHYKPDEKLMLIESMWQMAFADGDLDKYEERLIRQVSDLIHVSHRDFIRMKMQVAEGQPDSAG